MYPLIKRLIDLILAGIVLLLLLPLFIPILIGLRLTGEGEIFYLQKRIGYKNRYFHIWKFATMLKDSPNIGTGEITLRDDPRLTPMGKYLRMTKINELPQIINVLKGDMAIVGPRPLTEKAYLAYPAPIRSYIYDAKPGITGIGSIVFRDEEEIISASKQDPHLFYREHIAPYKGALELWYQKHRSTWIDLSLIFLTAWVIVFPKSQLHFRMYKDLPKPEKRLQKVRL